MEPRSSWHHGAARPQSLWHWSAHCKLLGMQVLLALAVVVFFHAVSQPINDLAGVCKHGYINDMLPTGGIFVNAALNFGTNLDESPLYPPSLKLPNMLVVGAVDEQLQRAGYSCYGAYVGSEHAHKDAHCVSTFYCAFSPSAPARSVSITVQQWTCLHQAPTSCPRCPSCAAITQPWAATSR